MLILTLSRTRPTGRRYQPDCQAPVGLQDVVRLTRCGVNSAWRLCCLGPKQKPPGLGAPSCPPKREAIVKRSTPDQTAFAAIHHSISPLHAAWEPESAACITWASEKCPKSEQVSSQIISHVLACAGHGVLVAERTPRCDVITVTLEWPGTS